MAHPSHAWRCWVLATVAGYSVSVPRVSGKFEWQKFGCDPWGFSPMAADERVRDEDAWALHEGPLQRRLSAQYPGLAASQLRQRQGPATATPVKVTWLEGAVLWLLCCGCVPGWEERAGLPTARPSGRGGPSAQPPRLQRGISLPQAPRSVRLESCASLLDGSPSSARGLSQVSRSRMGSASSLDGSPSRMGDGSPCGLSQISAEDELDEDDIIPVWHPRVGSRDMLSPRDGAR